MDFYDNIADDYDEMTDLSHREDKIEKFLKAVVSKGSVCSALDIACGTGMYSIKLAQMGIEAVGTDISARMLEKAKKLAQENSVNPAWVHASMQKLPAHINRTFDMILCLGNSIPHIQNRTELNKTLTGFVKLMHSSSVLFIHLLNYHRILAQKERIVAVTRKGNNQFIRFYDFLPELIQFNLLKICWDKDKNRHELFSTPLFPYTADDLVKTLQENHFSKINLYADYQFSPFNRDDSKSVLIEASMEKP